MNATLTDRQREILAIIARSVQRVGREPTLQAIGDELGGIAPPSVYKHLQALEKKGFLRRHPNQRPSIELVTPLPEGATDTMDVPLQAVIEAGTPLDETVAGRERIAVWPGLLQAHPQSIALRVRGYGLQPEGLLSGDLLIVERDGPPSPGATVVAVLDGGGATVRRYLVEDGCIRLGSVQPFGETLTVRQAAIFGTVIASIRSYSH